MTSSFETVPLFATPIVLSDVPDAAALNAELRKVIGQRQKAHPGTQHSNLGGWQSTWDMDRWGARRRSSCWPSPATSPTA